VRRVPAVSSRNISIRPSSTTESTTTSNYPKMAQLFITLTPPTIPNAIGPSTHDNSHATGFLNNT
jgi:hypothetical protein